LQRYLNACAGRGAYPIKFNGSLFSVDVPAEGLDPDFRRWGPCYWFQNTRLPYWSMLAAGDYDLMQPLFRMYRDALPLAQEKTRLYYGHEGAFFPETMYFWGTYNNDNYGWGREGKPAGLTDNTYIRYYWDSGLELATLMLDYHAQTGDAAFLGGTLLPLAGAVVEFYDQHYPRHDGKLFIGPSQALETWQEADNPLPVVAGLRYVLTRLLALPAAQLRPGQQAEWRRLLGELPPLPMAADGSRLLPAERFDALRNIENPELYAVFPYRLYGLGKPRMAVGRATFEARRVKKTGGWHQDAIQAALLGLTDQAAADTLSNFAHHHAGSRFPAFWGPNYDWIPDQDHGAVAMTALQRMLMQCDGERILLLPAWPADWDVSFRLHAPGGVTVDVDYVDAKAQRLTVTPEAARGRVTVGVSQVGDGGP
jgi:hypothetical protein